MRRPVLLLVSLALLTINSKASRVQQSSTQPQITSVTMKGKKLFVGGVNFNQGAVILINGEEVATRSDPDNPTGMLIAKKAGKRMPPDQVVTIAVQDQSGVKSQGFDFFSGLTITLEDAGKTITLRVGEKFQVALKRSGYEWTVNRFDSSVVTKLPDAPAVSDAQGIFQALVVGTTQFSAVGELPCHKSTPPCLAPTLLFQVTLIVQ
ncbi:MAG TPA: hypothetical protein VGL29_22780 [Blastocatellia bacterium]